MTATLPARDAVYYAPVAHGALSAARIRLDTAAGDLDPDAFATPLRVALGSAAHHRAAPALRRACAGRDGCRNRRSPRLCREPATQEIGIRLASAPTPGTVLQMVMRQGMTLVAVGLVLGFGGALLLSRLVQ